MALAYYGYKTNGYGASAGSADPYFDLQNVSGTGHGANLSVTQITSCSVSITSTGGSSSNGLYTMEIQALLNGTWYALGYVQTTERTSVHKTWSNFTSTADASLRSIMGKYALQGFRGKVVNGYFHMNPGAEIRLAADTALDYSKCTPPNSITLASNNVAPGATVRLSWSGHSAGINNPIASFNVYRSLSPDSGYALIGNVTTAYTNVVSHSSNNTSYYYKVLCLSSVSSTWNSDLSSARGTLTTYWTNPSAPTTVTLGGTAGNVYAYLNTTVRLAWSGASGGTNNAITGYRVLRNGAAFATTNASTLYHDVATHSTAGTAYTFTVVSVGVRGDSTASTGRILYNYTHPGAPTAVTIGGTAGNIYVSGGNVTLAWSGATNGTNNAITGYRVLRGGSPYQDVAASVSSLSVPAHSTAGASYTYTVQALGARSNSSASVGRAVYTYSNPSAPTTVTLSGTAGNIYAYVGTNVKLAWSGASAGSLNAITGYRIMRDGVAFANVAANVSSSDVPTHSTAGTAYTYTIITLGTYSNSAASVGRILYNYTHPGAPAAATVTLNNVAGTIYLAGGVNATLRWGDGTAGTNNAIGGYRILRDGITLTNLGSTIRSHQVASHTTAGNSYTFTVVALGARSNSAASVGRTISTYSNPSAPTTVTVDGATSTYALTGTNVLLAWSGARAGVGNSITGYRILRDGSTYQDVEANVSSLSVPTHATPGSNYAYSVITLGTYADSAASVARTVYNYTNVTAPNTPTIDASYLLTGQKTILRWSGATAGTNNNITGYQVLRNGSVLADVGSSVTTLEVDAHTTAGSNYSFTVVTKGARANSAASGAQALYTYSHPRAPTSVTVSSTYVLSGNVTLTWSGASDGSFNTIIGYRVLQGGEAHQDVAADVDSLGVPSHATPGNAYTYTVIALGARSNSAASAGASVYTYSHPSVPTGLNLTATLLNPGITTSLSWGAASAGGYNSVQGYEVHRSTAVNGTYTLLSSPAANVQSVSVAAPTTQGATYYYKVLTRGSRSNSALSAAIGPLKANTQPGVPTITYPVANTTTYSPTIGLNIVAPPEPDGQEMTLWLSINGAAFTSYGTVLGSQIVQVPVSPGTVTLVARLRDSMGLDSSTTTREFVAAVPSWTRAINTGTIIANTTISHRADINELLSRINTARAVYGFDAGTLPGTVGAFADWAPQMRHLQALLNEIFPRTGRSAPSWSTVPAYPTAAIINQLRTEIRRA